MNVGWSYCPDRTSSQTGGGHSCRPQSMLIPSQCAISSFRIPSAIDSLAVAGQRLPEYSKICSLTLMYRLLCSTTQSIARHFPGFPLGLHKIVYRIAFLFQLVSQLSFNDRNRTYFKPSGYMKWTLVRYRTSSAAYLCLPHP